MKSARTQQPPASGPKPAVHCAIYTRKSTSEGLDQAFNSLDAQREAAEAYIASQKAEGWICLPDRYDDGGYTGGNMERPALQELNKAVFNGEVDSVVLYKLDRLARTLYDGITLLHEWIARRGVRVVITTMQIDLSGALGQTVAALLLGLAQMEREAIRERQAAGIAAARARGKRWGGRRPGSCKVDSRKVKALAEKGLTQIDVAKTLGIHRRTVARILGTCRS